MGLHSGLSLMQPLSQKSTVEDVWKSATPSDQEPLTHCKDVLRPLDINTLHGLCGVPAGAPFLSSQVTTTSKCLNQKAKLKDQQKSMALPIACSPHRTLRDILEVHDSPQTMAAIAEARHAMRAFDGGPSKKVIAHAHGGRGIEESVHEDPVRGAS